MALFVDGPANTVDQLADEDSGLLQTAQICGINVTKKLWLAWEEIRSDLHVWLIRPRPMLELVWQPSLRVNQIVVNEPLRRWERMNALAYVYRDAYFSQLVDRYQAKWDEYVALTRSAREVFVGAGLELVNDPISKAQPPALSTTAGAGSGGVFYASVAWVNAEGMEGQASDPSSITVAAGEYMTVTAVAPPANATGFNVYAGAAPNAMTLQNTTLLTTGSTYTYAPGQVTGGRAPGCGQTTQFWRPLVRTMLRG